MKTGLYIHVPFCKCRCIYCDFYSTTCGEDVRRKYVDALLAELAARQDECSGGEIATIYLGGGTPSQLTGDEIRRIFDCIRDNYAVADDAEITFEANPDDVTDAYVGILRDAGVNRVSLGLQTFDDTLLRFLHRRHTAEQARSAVRRLHDGGIGNISIDLIYGLPNQTTAQWSNDLREALRLPVRHLSAYTLMYEPGTRITRMRDRHEFDEADDEVIAGMFDDLVHRTEDAGFEHYEISNFALPGYRSRHNSSYWNGTPYIGCGPGAHSFDGYATRRSNDANLSAYCSAPGQPPHSMEHLSEAERYDEMVFTALRTKEGLSLQALESRFGAGAKAELTATAAPHIAARRLQLTGHRMSLTKEGILVSDMVMSDLMRG